MSEARALTNLIGNGLATVVVAKWEGSLDETQLHRVLNQETDREANDPKSAIVQDGVAKEAIHQQHRHIKEARSSAAF
jgi:aerobic C4-dicarboxylate transport protein